MRVNSNVRHVQMVTIITRPPQIHLENVDLTGLEEANTIITVSHHAGKFMGLKNLIS